ncbi:MAG: DUF1579 domain-containing protein [Caulobacterales bacterium]|nr:DUF1579 domain-containing protein [Caulobacterales bacterium]
MMRKAILAGALFLAASTATTGAAWAQTPQAGVQAAQREAITKLSRMQGVWVGQASGINPDQSRYSVTQTERIGPMLDGTILVIEGRGYRADGSTGFNAFAVLSYDPEASKYELRSYAQGYSGTFELKPTDNGYVWEVPAGPGVMRYTSDITDTTYHEVGDFIMPGMAPMRAFEMTLTRRGDTDWPAANPVDPTP